MTEPKFKCMVCLEEGEHEVTSLDISYTVLKLCNFIGSLAEVEHVSAENKKKLESILEIIGTILSDTAIDVFHRTKKD